MQARFEDAHVHIKPCKSDFGIFHVAAFPDGVPSQLIGDKLAEARPFVVALYESKTTSSLKAKRAAAEVRGRMGEKDCV